MLKYLPILLLLSGCASPPAGKTYYHGFLCDVEASGAAKLPCTYHPPKWVWSRGPRGEEWRLVKYEDQK